MSHWYDETLPQRRHQYHISGATSDNFNNIRIILHVVKTHNLKYDFNCEFYTFLRKPSLLSVQILSQKMANGDDKKMPVENKTRIQRTK